MSSDLKQEYLDAKYAYFDGETDAKPKKKSKKKIPKKANHKHEYTNVIIEYEYPKNYPIQRLAGQPAQVIESYCTICGKMDTAKQDPVAVKLFPHIHTGHFGFLSHIAGYEHECENYRQWALSHYPHYSMPDYWEGAYRGQTFLDLDKIVPAEV